MDFESSGRLNQDWEHGTLQWAVEHTVFVVFDVPCSSWEGFDVMATQFLEAPNAQSWPEMLGLYLVGRILDLGKGNGEGVSPDNRLATCPQLTWTAVGSSYATQREVSGLLAVVGPRSVHIHWLTCLHLPQAALQLDKGRQAF
jgi:hypothetical protein